ncbi:MAG: SCO family protein [Bdellovibrionota bacterium]
MSNHNRTTKNVWIFWLTCIASAIVLGLITMMNYQNKIDQMIDETGGVVLSLPKLGSVSPFKFQERSGADLQNADLAGHIWVFNLMFTSCHGPCPLMSHHMSRLQRSFNGNELVKFVSLTVDPEVDTLEVLKKYADSYHARADQWFFLTGEKEKIVKFVTKSLKLPAGENPVLHSTRFVLVDANGEVRGYYDSQERAQMERLKGHIKLLLESISDQNS